MSCTCFNHRIYKGEDAIIVLPRPLSEQNFSLKLYTTGDTCVQFPYERLELVDRHSELHVEEHDLDLLPDGVIRYRMEYTLEGITDIIETNTSYTLKTPGGYVPAKFITSETVDNIWTGTLAEYQALTPDSNTIYFIKG